MNGEVDQSLMPRGGIGLGGQLLSWVTDPARYILMSEPPARRDGGYLYHWHYRRGPSDVCAAFSEPLRDPQRFISPILFVDGHVAKHDFTKAIQANPWSCCEPTEAWVWYQSTSDRTFVGSPVVLTGPAVPITLNFYDTRPASNSPVVPIVLPLDPGNITNSGGVFFVGSNTLISVRP